MTETAPDTTALDAPAMVSALLEHLRTEIVTPDVAVELTEHTPLLSAGVLDSMQTARLLVYIRRAFGVRVPPAQMSRGNFANVLSIVGLVCSLQAAGS